MQRRSPSIAMPIHSRRSADVSARLSANSVAAAGEIDEPIAIRQAKRFMADRSSTPRLDCRPRWPRTKHIKVAVVGAGPCGLTAALRLAQHGYQVTVFERMPEPGGMMTYGIPAYRLPREVLFREIEHIRRAGVEIPCGHELGIDFTIKSLQHDGYKAIVLGAGCAPQPFSGCQGRGQSRGLSCACRCCATLPLAGSPNLSGKRVVVVGGGDTAMDAARSALAPGGKRSPHRLSSGPRSGPCPGRRVRAPRKRRECNIHFLVNPILILGDRTVTGVRLQRQKLGDFDCSGRRRPVPIPGSEFDMPCDLLVPAIGQITWVDDESVGMHRKDSFPVGKAFEINVPGVFAAGDAVSGPATVVQSVAHGNQVALAVDAWLSTGKLDGVHYRPVRNDIPQLFNINDYANAHRPREKMLGPEERICRQDFCEVEMGLGERTVQEECKRCLRCDLEWLERIGEPMA